MGLTVHLHLQAGPDGEQALQPSIVTALIGDVGGLPAWLQCYACSSDTGVRAATIRLLEALLSVGRPAPAPAQRTVSTVARIHGSGPVVGFMISVV